MFVFLRIVASIFYQILYMSIVASVVGLVILLIQKIINKRLSPKCNYFIWLVFIIILVFPIVVPSKFSIYNYIDINFFKSVDNEYIVNNWKMLDDFEQSIANDIKNDNSLNNVDLFSRDLKIIIANILLFISLMNIIKIICSYIKTISTYGNEKVTNKRILDIVDDCKKELNIKRNIKVINQNINKTPAIIGLFNIKIMFSENLLSFDDQSLKNMFLHELSHYKRKDNYMNFLIFILKAIYWFNPIVTYMFKYIKMEMEFATDELAIRNMNVEEIKHYCQTIVKAEGLRSSKLSPVLCFCEEKENTIKRINVIALKSKFKKFSKILSASTTFIIFAICLVFYPSSYGVMNIPELYLELNDGSLTEIINTDDFVNSTPNEIIIKETSNAKVVIKNSGINDFIYYNKMNLNNEADREKSTIILNEKIVNFEKGNYLYNFTVVNERGKNFNYLIKIIVE